jgi:signal peptidase I
VIAAPPPSPAAARATRLILLVGVVLFVLLAVGVGALVAFARSLGIGTGTGTIHVVGSAMAPTLRDGDYVSVQFYRSGGPRVGDIVVMRDPYDRSRSFIKRVVAVPGETVLIRHGQLFVNGNARDEPYVDPAQPWTELTEWPTDGKPLTLASGDYFVLGDNRDHSSDSRTFGPVHRSDIRYQAVHIVLPRDRSRPL